MSFDQYIKNYQEADFNAKTQNQIMVQVYEKAINNLITAKELLEKKEYVELGRAILKVVKIFNALSRTVIVDDGNPTGEVLFNFYHRMAILIESLVAQRAPANEYDYYINYLTSIKNTLVSTEANAAATKQDAPILKVDNVEENSGDFQIISPFNKEGKFEVIT